jgi:hypothetical protein
MDCLCYNCRSARQILDMNMATGRAYKENER